MKRSDQTITSVIEAQAELEPGGNGYTNETLASEPQVSQQEWFWLLWETRRLLWRWTIRGLIVTTIIAFVIPKRYESTVRLMPPDSMSSSGSGLALLAGMASRGEGGSALGSTLGGVAGDLLGLQSTGALFVDMLRSRTVADHIVDRFDLRKVYGVRLRQGARKTLAARTDVALDKKSGVITVTVADRDPHRAAQIGQAYVEELDRLVADVSTSSARRERIFIEQRLKTVKQDLDRASKEFSEYSSKNATIDVKEQGAAMVAAAAALQGQLIAAQSELEGLEQIYTDGNVRIRSLRARVEELKRQLEKLGGDTPTSGSDPNASNSGELYPSIRKLPLLGVRWADLYRETKIQETVFELLTEQYEMAKIQEAKEIPSVKVLDAADVPEKKSSPPRLLIMILGTFLTFTAGVAWVLGTAFWQQTDPHDSRKQLAQEVGNKIRWRLAKLLEPLRNRFRGSKQEQDSGTDPAS